jgi:hypothetical protein
MKSLCSDRNSQRESKFQDQLFGGGLSSPFGPYCAPKGGLGLRSLHRASSTLRNGDRQFHAWPSPQYSIHNGEAGP